MAKLILDLLLSLGRYVKAFTALMITDIFRLYVLMRKRLKNVLKIVDRYGMLIIMTLYLYNTYVTYLLFTNDIISEKLWVETHFGITHLLFILFVFLMKKNLHPLVYSLCSAVFVARFICQAFFGGWEQEYDTPWGWGLIYETPLALLLTYISYKLNIKK